MTRCRVVSCYVDYVDDMIPDGKMVSLCTAEIVLAYEEENYLYLDAWINKEEISQFVNGVPVFVGHGDAPKPLTFRVRWQPLLSGLAEDWARESTPVTIEFVWADDVHQGHDRVGFADDRGQGFVIQ